MARFWGVSALVLSFLLSQCEGATIPVEEESSSSEVGFDTGYLIVAPKVFVAESVETICISLQNMTGPLEVAIRLMDNTTAMAKLPIQFMEFRMACYDMEVPAIEFEMMHATLMVKLRRTLVTQTGWEVVEKRMITINGINTEMFIETDKPVYKPGQTVKFRILNINQDLKPDVSPVNKIWIESPSGVRMQQWRNQESTDGLIDLEMPMTSDPTEGTWSIVATHKGRKTTRTFKVEEYVLPKFEVIITPPPYVMINTTVIRVKICGRYTYGQPVRGSFEARITVKSTGWNFRERKTITRRVDDTGPSGCNDFPVDLTRLELNSTDFSLWNARLSVDVDYTEASTGVILEANSESTQITRDALKLQFDSPNIFKPGVPYYGKIIVTYPDGSPAAGKLISLSCNTDQGQIFDKNLTSPENGAIEFTVTDINITSTSLNLYAHAPGVNIPSRETHGSVQAYTLHDLATSHYTHLHSPAHAPGFNIPSRETHGREHAYTLHDPATSHYARPQYSPSGSFLQMAPIRGMAAVGSEQTVRIDFTARDPEENPRFRFVVMSRGNIIATRFYRAHKRPKRQADGGSSPSDGSEGSESGPSDGSIDGLPSIPSAMPSDIGSFDIPSFIPSVLGGSSMSSDYSFVPPTDAPVIIVEPGEVYSQEIYFRVTPEMVPETRILAYYIRKDGEVVADSIAFRVQKKFENEVDIAFSDEEQMPGAETQIMIHASPGSLCAVGVVDRSVHILGGDNQLKADKIFNSLNKYQLTSAGGYIDVSTHCVPEEDEYPQFFPLGRKKRGIFLPGYGSKYQDSSRAFKDMGLVFITNMDVETSPCVGAASLARGTAEIENAAEGPVPVPLQNEEDAVFDDKGILEKPELPNDVLETAPRIRSYFPETWLWDLRRTDSVTGETSISMEVPDTVTEWIGSGFCTSVEYGVGVSPPTKLRAFQPFFLSYTLPYSVVRGEVVPVTVTVFNYLTESLVVEVSLELNEGFRMARRSRPRKRVCVGGSESQSVEFRILPRKLGNIALQALGISVNDRDALCGNELVSSSVGARDSIYKELLVEAEGTEVDTTQNCYFCPGEGPNGEYEREFNVTLPADIVEGSARGKVSITGDLMGPSLSNLDHLIQLPTGCGEQNMLGFVPNIVALSYLTTTDQLTPSVENKAKFNMKRGYQRELNYRHRDGSYSAFGESDPEGSTWLTAFVVRSFAQARDYIYIDEDDLDISISWLRSLQSPETGCFQSRGKLCHKDMKGGVNSERTLTSYVLISLLEAGLNIQDQVITDALNCVTKDLLDVEDTYTLAQLAYALTLAESPIAQDVMDKLETKAVQEDGLKYWQTNRAKPNGTRNLYAYQAPSTDIEMTSYILLALIGRTTDITQALLEGNPIARWIVLQRNSNGGFSSTQDTVVALQALSEFAKVAYSEGTSIKAFVEVTPLEDKDAGAVFPFTITTLNRLVLEEEALPGIPAQLTLFASGSGCALMQISTTHNEIPETPEDAGFELDVLVLESYESSKNTRCTDYYMKVCARYTGSDEESNMAIIQVKMVSGFYPDKESLRLLQKQHKPLQRFEVDNKNVFFYFNELTNEDTCLVFSVIKEIDVEEAKPGVVQVYDYYDKEVNVKQLYNITCEEATPSWDASLLYTIPVKPSENAEDVFGNDGDMRPLPFVLAALRRMDGLVFIDPPPGELEGGSEGIGGSIDGSSASDADGGDEENAKEKMDMMEVARELGPPDVFILCPAGQKFVDGLMQCVPINGCESSPCLEGQNCIDTDAGYLCVGCKPGYRKGRANQCIRIPDPGLNQIACGPGQEFVNGGCITVDQCIDNPCPIDARCTNTAFGHTCETVFCPPGRELTPDLQCLDVDECLRNPCHESELCINKPIYYECVCAEGYERDATNICVDINECESEIEPCGGPEYTCMNDKGSYQCFCVEGYTMDDEGYCVQEEQESASATRSPQEIAQETTNATSQRNVTEESTSDQLQEGPSFVNSTSSPAVQVSVNPKMGNDSSVIVNATVSVSTNATERPPTSDDSAAGDSGIVSSNATSAVSGSVAPSLNSSTVDPAVEGPLPANETLVQNSTVIGSAANTTDAPSNVPNSPINETEASSNVTDAASAVDNEASSAANVSSNIKVVGDNSTSKLNSTTDSYSNKTIPPSSAVDTAGSALDTSSNATNVHVPSNTSEMMSNSTGATISAPDEASSARGSSTTVPSTNTTGSSSNATIPSSNVTLPASSGTAPSSNVTVHSRNVTAPSSNTTAPSRNATMPSSNATVTSSDVVDPSSNTTVPSSNATIPSSNATIPSSNATIPSSNNTVPSSSTTAPLSNNTVPSSNATVPSSNTTVLSSNATVPSSSTTAPLSNNTVPSSKATIPSSSTAAPLSNNTVPSSNGTIPSSNATDSPNDGDGEGTGDMPMRGDGTVQQGHGGDRDGGRQIIDHGGIKPGTCPPEVSGGFGICGGTPCRGDEDCPGTNKCCQRNCGKMCMAVNIEVPAIDPPVRPPVRNTHPGACPVDLGTAPSRCDGPLCIIDSECEPWEKCCHGCGDGMRCMPAPQIQPPVLPPVEPPQPLTCPHTGPDGRGNCDGQMCTQDSDCFMNELCCTSACGSHCTVAVPVAPQPPPEVHLGRCPSVEAEGACGNAACLDDGDCAMAEKCCVSSCGLHCTPSLKDEPQPLSKECTGDLVFHECNNLCPNYCGMPSDAALCIMMCEPGCGCPLGMIRETENSNRCVVANECPKAPEPEPQPVSKECTGDLVFQDCNNMCPNYCGMPSDAPLCIMMCEPGCGCPLGMMRETENSDQCVTENECPSAPEPEPQPVSKECTGDLVFHDCNNLCPNYCGMPPDAALCIMMCEPGCGCPLGMMRETENSNRCVTENECPSEPDPPAVLPLEVGGNLRRGPFRPRPAIEKQCTGDLEFQHCAVVCQRTCEQPNKRPCIKMCGIGCYCPVGQIRESLESDRCFADVLACPREPEVVPEVLPAKSKCTGDLIFNECGTACELTCGDYEPRPCTRQCVPGCFCPSGHLRVSQDSDECVPINEGAAINAMCPSERVKLSCTGDLRYEECGTSCELTCDDFEPRPCILLCVSGCFCPPQHLRVSAGSDECVPIMQDAPMDMMCPNGGGGGGGPFGPGGPPGIDRTCTGDLVWNDCASACDPTCAEPAPTVCTFECRIGCYCPHGTVRESLESDRCFDDVSSCSTDGGEPLGPGILGPDVDRTCTGDLVWNECASACDPTCAEPAPTVCTFECRIGCYCPHGTVRESLESDRCFDDVSSCPTDNGPPAPLPDTRPCETERRTKMEESEGKEGVFIPQCTPDGYYAMEQCYEDNGIYCWCADPKTGVVIPESEVHEPSANCERFLPDPTSFNQCPPGKEFANGVKKCVPICEGDLEYQECGSPCPETCNAPSPLFCIAMCDPGCKCPFGMMLTEEGSTSCVAAADCPPPPPPPCDEGYTHNEAFECVVENPCSEALAAAQEGGLLIGEFEPSCTAEGNYEEVQCHGSTGFCWCVHSETGLRQGPNVRGTPDCAVRVECDAGYMLNDMFECVVENPCSEALAAAQEGGILIGEFEPSCTAEGNYEDVQCWGSTGFCWCVHSETGLRHGPNVRGMPDCSVPVVCDEGFRLNDMFECIAECENGMEYKECGHSCRDYCGKPEFEPCPLMCVPGCACPEGTKLIDLETNICVAEADCPNPCEGDLVYDQCGSACPAVCNEEPALFCIEVCISGCHCPPGTMRAEPDSTTCVPADRCPPPPPGPPVVVEVSPAVDRPEFVCPGKLGRCLFGFEERTNLACTEECSDDYDCPGERKCCSHSCGSVCVYPSFPVPQPYPELVDPRPDPPPAAGISVNSCPAQDAAVETCGGACSVDEDCGAGEMCCSNAGCEGLVCLPLITEQKCKTIPCPIMVDSEPEDLREKICGSSFLFIVKIRSDGRAKILDDMKYYNNPYAKANERPIVKFIKDAGCSLEMTADRYILMMGGDAVDLPGKVLTLDHTVLAIPLTGHLKNKVKDISDTCPQY